MPQTSSHTDTAEWRPDWVSTSLVLGFGLLLFYLVPLVSLLIAQPPGSILAILDSPRVVSTAPTSVLASLLSTLIAATFGLPLAYWLARTQNRISDVLTAIVVLPLVLPPIVSGMVLLTVVGPNTLLGTTASAYGIPITRSLVGVVLAQTFVASPFLVITAKAAFESVDRSLEYASRTLGKDRRTTFRRVTLPLAWPGVVAGLTLTFARAMGEFGATIMLAYYPRTMPVEIWVSFSTRGLDEAFPIAVVLIGVSVTSLVLINALGTSPLD